MLHYEQIRCCRDPFQRILQNIYQKFEDIRLHRVSFEDEKVNLYRTAINKYSSELSEDK